MCGQCGPGAHSPASVLASSLYTEKNVKEEKGLTALAGNSGNKRGLGQSDTEQGWRQSPVMNAGESANPSSWRCWQPGRVQTWETVPGRSLVAFASSRGARWPPRQVRLRWALCGRLERCPRLQTEAQCPLRKDEKEERAHLSSCANVQTLLKEPRRRWRAGGL